jgi:hypothetical protein
VRPQPHADAIPIGGSVQLRSVHSLAREVGLSQEDTAALLTDLEVPILRVQGTREGDSTLYFDLWSLEVALRVRLSPGGPGFGWPPKSAADLAVDEDQPGVALDQILYLLNEVSKYYGKMTRNALKRRCKSLAKQIHEELASKYSKPLDEPAK